MSHLITLPHASLLGLALCVGTFAATLESPALLEKVETTPAGVEHRPESNEPESLAPIERLLPDGSRSGSLVYVDSHGDLVQVKYRVGPSAGARGFHLEETPVHDRGLLGGRWKRGARDVGALTDVLPQASAQLRRVLPPPVSVMRAPTPRPSDAFWQPKQRADLKRPPPIRWW